MLKIGISASFIYPDPSRAFFGKKTLTCLENDMAHYLARPGVMPILIPDLTEPCLSEFLRELDGFVFQGGSDIAPQTYGQTPLNSERWPGDPQRDRYELALMEFAVSHRKPVLGICRGCQLINVYFGGTLYQDLPTQREQRLEHRNADLYDRVHHGIVFKKEGVLAKLYHAAETTRVNSVHHQGIQELGKGLIVEATCPEDGLVEAIAYQNLKEKFVLGVQWHPEFSRTLAHQVIAADPLYDFFLNEVTQCQRHSK